MSASIAAATSDTTDGIKHLLITLELSLRERKISGKDYCAQKTALVDKALNSLFAKTFDTDSAVCLMALGGYGRAELCPHSDLDIMFFSPEELSSADKKSVENFLYAVWDAGIKIGHSVRTLRESLDLSQNDAKIMSSLLDARSITGNINAGARLASALRAMLGEPEKRAFLRSKLEERDARHARYGDTRYALEPNLKEGKGGLRDYQTLLWITNVLYGASKMEDLAAHGILTQTEARKFRKSYDFLLTVRCHLHDLAGRAEERLHFDIQPDLAERFGYANRTSGRNVERFMKHYFLITRDIGDLTRIILSAIEHDLPDESGRPQKDFLGFELKDGRLAFDEARPLQSNPLDMLRLFHVSQRHNHHIHPVALKEISRNLRYIDADIRDNAQANAIFIDILTSGDKTGQTLRRMNESGVLGRFVPDFARIAALMQFDRYHHYTVDEHTLHCVDILDRLRKGHLKSDAPLSSDVAQNITKVRPLYTALFLHDICKGRGGRHADLGAELALSLCPRFGLDGEETDLVSWLVLEHLLMSDTAFRRNLNDPKTIADFTARVRTPHRLDLLFILTTADIMGVGPGRWTAWKARLLEELYLKTKTLMAGDEPGMVRDTGLPAGYVPGETRIDVKTDETQCATVIMVYTPDRPGLFALLCGALSSEGANIMRAYINTLDENVAADRFVIQNASGLPFYKERRQEDLKDAIRAALDGTLDIRGGIDLHRAPLTRKDLVFDIVPKIALNNDVSGSDTVVEIETRDRHGLLYDIARLLGENGLDIRAAKINTQGLRAIDSFYVQTAKRKKLTDAKAQKRLVETLEANLANS